jgi:hypothetical protein
MAPGAGRKRGGIGLFRRGNTAKPCAKVLKQGTRAGAGNDRASAIHLLSAHDLCLCRHRHGDLELDISPIILFLIILFIQSVILPNIAKLFI